MEKALIGIDLGTTVCKCAIYDEKLKIISQASIEYELIKNSSSEIEQDPERWWEVVGKTVREALCNAEFDKSKIKGISVSSQGIAFVPVDRNCMPLCNAISWLDSRAVEEKELLERKFGRHQIFSISGKPLNEYYTLPKILWLKRNRPLLFRKIHKILTAHDFIIARLSGRFVTDHTLASGTMAYDISRCSWSTEILDSLDLEPALFPEILESGTAVGTICKAAADKLGLREDVLVITGGQDQKCAALGAGIHMNAAAVSLGTATAIIKICDHAVMDKHMELPCFKGLGEKEWILEGGIATSCACLNWLRDNLLTGYSNIQFDEAVAQHYGSMNKIFFYPYFAVPANNDDEGLSGCFYGITLAANTAEIIRSVYEGIAYQIRLNIEKMEEISGAVDELLIYGGGSNSDIWCRMISDITRKKVSRLQNRETACMGAAILAGLGTGVFADIIEASKEMEIKTVFKPGYISDLYDEYYHRYIKFQKKIIGL